MATKTTRKQVKASSKVKSEVTAEEPKSQRQIPNAEEIRELAELLYHQRTEKGEQGTDLDDWLRAEEYLRCQENV
ncbi:MAG: hypothetical protein JXR66_11730 [Bacteroidales bacterium]|nr:hypothetical protein [Bacteroidales bacterium]